MKKLRFYFILYTLFMVILLPFIILRLIYKSIKNPDYRKRINERLSLLKMPPSFEKTIWIHAVSVGETVASIPLVKRLQVKYPNKKIVITTMTPTGSNKVKQVFKDSVIHSYIPYDIPFLINRFIKIINPEKLLIIETELWPNLINCCKNKNIELYLINARLSDKSRKGYEKIKSLSKYILNSFKYIFAQYNNDAENFIKLGADKNRVLITGNIKFDIETDIQKIAAGKELKTQLKNKFVICAASTHEGEEQIILKQYLKLKKLYENIFLILVPRHPERFNQVEKLIKNSSVPYKTRSSHLKIEKSDAILLGDTMGELIIFYAASDIAFVGGSLIPIGGHNLLEPAALNLPIITGNYLHNFKSISELMLNNNALLTVNNEQEFFSKLKELITNNDLRKKLANNAKKFVEANKGSINKIFSFL